MGCQARTLTSEAISIAAGSEEFNALASSIYEAAMTIVRDEKKILLPNNLKDKKTLIITHGDADPFIRQFALYKESDHIAAELEVDSFSQRLSGYDIILYVYVPPVYMIGGLAARMFFGKLEPAVLTELEFIQNLNKNLALVLCASPFLLYSLPADIPVLVAYESQGLAQQAAADALCGKNPLLGRLPLILSDPIVADKVDNEKDL